MATKKYDGRALIKVTSLAGAAWVPRPLVAIPLALLAILLFLPAIVGAAPIEQAKLSASDGAAFDVFGTSVSVFGDTAVVGAPADDGNADSSGSAYVFIRSGTTWTEQARLTAGDGAEGDNLGVSVSVAGDTALLGAGFSDDNGSDSGSAYVFIRSGTTWTEQAKLTASDRENFEMFGTSVSVAGGTAVVGAPRDDDDGTNSGSAYVYLLAADAVTVEIDIKPASDPNCFNNNGNGVIPVAILGSVDFDVTQIDADSVQLEGMSVKTVGKSNKLLANVVDSDGDGFDDLVVKIEDQDGVFAPGDSSATLTGNLLPEFGSTLIEGTDSICITH